MMIGASGRSVRNLTRQRQVGDVGQAQVEQDDDGRTVQGVHDRQGVGAGGGLPDRIPRVGQPLGQRPADQGLVVDDQNAGLRELFGVHK